MAQQLVKPKYYTSKDGKQLWDYAPYNELIPHLKWTIIGYLVRDGKKTENDIPKAKENYRLLKELVNKKILSIIKQEIVEVLEKYNRKNYINYLEDNNEGDT